MKFRDPKDVKLRKPNSLLQLLGIVGVDFDATIQLLVMYSVLVKYFKKWEYSEAVH
jgi:hypothetical protein